MFFLFELGHKTAETKKNICSVEGEDSLDHSTVNRWFKKFHFNDPVRSGKPQNVDSDAMIQAIEANPASTIRRVSGDLSILKSSVIHHFHSIAAELCLTLLKIAKVLIHLSTYQP